MKKTEFFYEAPEMSVVSIINECVVCTSVTGVGNESFVDDDADDLWR